MRFTNINNIQEKQEIKNYKVLCELLDEPTKTGKSKQLQLKDWERYFEYHKQGQKFIIDKIYKDEIPKEDGRMFGNNSIFAEDIQYILLCVLYRLPSSKVIWGCSTLLNNLSMINSNYITGRQNITKLSKDMNMDTSYIYDFYNNTHSSLKSKLETALNILARRSLITCEKIMMLQKESIQIEKNEFGTPKIKNGQVCYRKFEFSDEATDDEKALVIKIERRILDEMNFKDKKDAFIQGKWYDFKKAVDTELHKSNIKYSYYAYKIIFNKEDIEKEVLGELGEWSTRNILNKNIIESLIKSCENKHNKAIKIFGVIQGSKTKINNHKLRKKDDYVENNKQLIDKLIKR